MGQPTREEKRLLMVSLRDKMREIAHSLEGGAIGYDHGYRLIELVDLLKLGGEEGEAVRLFRVFLKSLSATLTEQARGAREVTDRFEDLLPKVSAT